MEQSVSIVGASDLPGDKDPRCHTCAARGGNTRHSSILQSFPVIALHGQKLQPSFTTEEVIRVGIPQETNGSVPA